MNPPEFYQIEMSEHDEYWIESNNQHSDKSSLAYLIPGNPGAVRSYKFLIQGIHEKTGFDICVCGHRGHSAISTKTYSLDEQIDHHFKKISEYSKHYTSFYIIAHSLGGYISYKISEKLETLKNKFKGFFLISPVFSRFPEALVRSYTYYYTAPIFNDITGGNFIENMFVTLDQTIEQLDALPYCFFDKNTICIVFAFPDKFIPDLIQQEVNDYLNKKIESSESIFSKSLPELRHSFYSSHAQTQLLTQLFDSTN